MKFVKSAGLTESEKILAQLCEHSFLSLWTYPNVYRTKGKELCDLLVVFGSHVLIFSDKCRAYPNTGNPEVDWKRWFRKSIYDSAAQIHRAEQWIIQHQDRIFLDPGCLTPLPISLPHANEIKIHRICVALGLEAENAPATSLNIKPTVVDDQEPLTIGRITAASGWTHFFGANEIQTAISLLDTASDFIDYLTKKEALLESGQLVEAKSETDLIAIYLWHGRKFKESAGVQYRIEPDLLGKVLTNRQFLAGKDADRVSYFWDGLIERFNSHFLQDILEFGNDATPDTHEKGVRILASEGRFARRVLCGWLLERAEKDPKNFVSSFLPSPSQKDVVYVLLIGPGAPKDEYAEYRKDRSRKLTLRCFAAKAKCPQSRYFIGLALEARGVVGQSEDLQILDTSEWTQVQIDEANKMAVDLGYFQGVPTHRHITEYPEN